MFRRPQSGPARVLVLPSRAPAPRPRTIHDRTLVVRRAPRRSAILRSRGLTALLTSNEACAGGLLLAWGLWGLWLSVAAGAVSPA